MTNQKGFTLVELLVGLALAIIVTGVMYSLYKAQNQTSVVQGYVSDMQQTLRASTDMMSREIRIAGYDPSGTGNYGITNATAQSMSFTADICEDGGAPANGADCTEVYQVELYTVDGINKLRRTAGGSAIAENIDNFELCYFTQGAANCSTNPVNLGAIDRVIISTLIRAPREDSSYTFDPAKITLTSGSGADWTPAVGDGFRRRMVVKQIKLRNLGL